ncbi:MAG: hypothetical protein ACOZNI_25695 [Myxococcota bacterium]
MTGELARGAAPEACDVVDSLFRLMRVVGMHGGAHPASSVAAADVAEAVARAAPPFAMQFVAGGVFRDHVLVPLDAERYERVRALSTALDNLSAHEVLFEDVPDVPILLRFGEGLARGAISRSAELESVRLAPIRVREIPAATRGVGGEDVDPEVFAVAQAVLAVKDAERLAPPPAAWDWSAGLTIVRRLDRAASTSQGVVAAAVESGGDGWTVGRRATAASLRTLTALRAARASTLVYRSTAHAVLALCRSGLLPREGLAVHEAAAEALAAMSHWPGHGPVESHRLRVVTILDHVAAGEAEGSSLHPGVLPLVRLAYEFEAARRPRGVEFDLTIVDLLADAMRVPMVGVNASWLRMIVQVAGVVPPGAPVRLADGRVGVAIGPGPRRDPMRPDVLVDGVRVSPDRDVELLASPRQGRGAR